MFNEINNLRLDLEFKRYPQGFTDSVIKPKGSSRPNKVENVLDSV
jgi:hypothetical protein